MNFLSSLFGDLGGTGLTAIFALGVVVVLIVLGVWLLKMVSNVSGSVARGRNKRMAIVDTLQIDPKRQLVIVRRDNVEHLILTGGPQDLVIESAIPVEEPHHGQTARRPAHPPATHRQAAPTPSDGSSGAVGIHPSPASVTAVLHPVPSPPREPEAESISPIERLRNLGKPAVKRGPRSLRHTGLLKPVESQEALPTGQNPDISDLPDSDSAKEVGETNGSEGAAFEQETSNSDADRK